jgi:hypothetical protein
MREPAARVPEAEVEETVRRGGCAAPAAGPREAEEADTVRGTLRGPPLPLPLLPPPQAGRCGAVLAAADVPLVGRDDPDAPEDPAEPREGPREREGVSVPLPLLPGAPGRGLGGPPARNGAGLLDVVSSRLGAGLASIATRGTPAVRFGFPLPLPLS